MDTPIVVVENLDLYNKMVTMKANHLEDGYLAYAGEFSNDELTAVDKEIGMLSFVDYYYGRAYIQPLEYIVAISPRNPDVPGKQYLGWSGLFYDTDPSSENLARFKTDAIDDVLAQLTYVKATKERYQPAPQSEDA